MDELESSSFWPLISLDRNAHAKMQILLKCTFSAWLYPPDFLGLRGLGRMGKDLAELAEI